LNAIFDRLKHAWNAFKTNESGYIYQDLGMASSRSPTRANFSPSFGRSMVSAICNRMAIDVAAYDIQHVRIDPEKKRYTETIKSGLNNCLTIEANVDQTGRAFIQDIVMSMFDEGFVAIIPTDTTISPIVSNSYEINALRTGKIIDWFPNHVRVELYNDRVGLRQEIVLPKSMVAIVENPLYSVMNEPNSTLKRLMHKLLLMDNVDEQVSSGKIDLIIQLPYVIKTELRQKQAEERRKAIEDQLIGSKYGIAYIDGTERVTQLNRAAENNLLQQIEYLTKMLYAQLGISEAVFNGTANTNEMANYYNRTIEPIITAIIDEMSRKFLTKTARSQGQTIMGFRDVFRLIPANEIADIADSFTRNEILSSNEIRSILGLKPSESDGADELRNKNMPYDGGMMEEGEAADPGIPYDQVQELLQTMADEYDTTMQDILDEIQENINTTLGEDGEIEVEEAEEA
jgi:hypothetical protein